MMAPISPEIDSAAVEDLLPQTQCTRCGYPDCRRYAEAIANAETDYNRCPPGGQETIDRLATLLDKPVKSLADDLTPMQPQSARIDEATCIGYTKCIEVCPTDAIIGAPKRLHTIIESECTGCELCLPPCPVDCIELVAGSRWLADRSERAKTRYRRHTERLQRQGATRRARAKKHRELVPHSPATLSLEDKKAVITAAIARAKARRGAPSQSDAARD